MSQKFLVPKCVDVVVSMLQPILSPILYEYTFPMESTDFFFVTMQQYNNKALILRAKGSCLVNMIRCVYEDKCPYYTTSKTLLCMYIWVAVRTFTHQNFEWSALLIEFSWHSWPYVRMNERVNMWTNICSFFVEKEEEGDGGEDEEEERQNHRNVSLSPIKNGPANQPTNRWKYQNVQSLNTCLTITIHMLTWYDKNIVVNMDDIDDNDRTMTWDKFFCYDQDKHMTMRTATTATVWHRSHWKRSIHNEQQ